MTSYSPQAIARNLLLWVKFERHLQKIRSYQNVTVSHFLFP
jgi:hypothetical protein